MAKLRIVPFDRAGADFVGLARLWGAQIRHDTPQWPVYDPQVVRDNFRVSNSAVTVCHWVGLRESVPVALLELLLPKAPGAAAHMELIVHPKLRRRGIGSALLRLAGRRAASAGFTTLATVAIEPLPSGGMPRGPAGRQFCRRHGMAPVLTTVRRRLDLREFDEERCARLDARIAEHAAGYTVATWRDTAADPDARALAYLHSRMSTDVPRGALSWAAMSYEPEQWRSMERMSVRRRRTTYYAGVRRGSAGALAGYTAIMLSARPREFGQQQATIVDPLHRGHRLGLAMKLANLRAVRRAEPRLRYIHALNARSNTPMAAVNDALGFRPCDLAVTYQWELSDDYAG